MTIHLRAAFMLALVTLLPAAGRAQTSAHTDAEAADDLAAVFASSMGGMDSLEYAPGGAAAITRGQPAPAGVGMNPLSRIGFGAYTSPLGLGVGSAVEVTRSTNLRAGWNFLNYNVSGTDDGANYSGNLHFRSFQGSVDWFPFHGSFHVSPGVLFRNQNRVTAQGAIAGGTSFALNDVNYYSSTADPVTGSGSIRFKSAAPMFTVGWGNWVSRHERKHLSFPFEVGFAHTGDAIVKLNLQGAVCNAPNDMYCEQIASDPSVQANITGQVEKLQKDLQWIRFYPILSGGVAYKF